jgi:hypothetical protein
MAQSVLNDLADAQWAKRGFTEPFVLLNTITQTGCRAAPPPGRTTPVHAVRSFQDGVSHAGFPSARARNVDGSSRACRRNARFIVSTEPKPTRSATCSRL